MHGKERLFDEEGSDKFDDLQPSVDLRFDSAERVAVLPLPLVFSAVEEATSAEGEY